MSLNKLICIILHSKGVVFFMVSSLENPRQRSVFDVHVQESWQTGSLASRTYSSMPQRNKTYAIALSCFLCLAKASTAHAHAHDHRIEEIERVNNFYYIMTAVYLFTVLYFYVGRRL